MSQTPIFQAAVGHGAVQTCARLAAKYGERCHVFDRRSPVFPAVSVQRGACDVLLERFACFVRECCADPARADAFLICDLTEHTDEARIEREACALIAGLLGLQKDIFLAVTCESAYRLAAPVLRAAAERAGYLWQECFD